MNDKLLLERWNIMAGLSEEDMMEPMDEPMGEEMPPEGNDLVVTWSDWLSGLESGSTLADLVAGMSGLCQEMIDGENACTVEVGSDSDMDLPVYTITFDAGEGMYTIMKDDEELSTAESMDLILVELGIDAAEEAGASAAVIERLREEMMEMTDSEESEEMGDEDDDMPDLEEIRLMEALRRLRALRGR